MLPFKESLLTISISAVLSSNIYAVSHVCNTNVSGEYLVSSNADTGDNSLNSCLQLAIASNTDSVVTFNSDMTITLSSELSLSGDYDITINGGDHEIIIDGNATTRIFDDTNSADITLENLTLQNGSSSSDIGGALLLDMDGSVTINNSTISGNTALWGGGIYNYGTLIISNSIISGNTVEDAGGGIFNNGDLTISNSTISDNSATEIDGIGGGIMNDNLSTSTISGSTVSGNTADYGGGLYNINSSTSTISNSTISGNTADYGGGLYSINSYSNISTISNSTISGNSALEGGGIVVNRSDLTITDSTISDNTADNDLGGLENYNDSSIVTISNTILYGNTNNGTTSDANTITSDGYNLVGDIVPYYDSNTDIIGTDPELGPLQDNGGPTYTHALSAASAAIDVGSSLETADQRGKTRDAMPDIGAYEYQGVTMVPVYMLLF